jgi:predicted flap endonuclease-1-like 5' DNA nuclease
VARRSEQALESEEVLGPEEFEALLVEGAATFEPSTAKIDQPKPKPPLAPARARTWPALDARKITPPTASASAEHELTTLRAELTRLTRQMRARDAYLQELERALEHNRRELAAAGLGTGLHAASMFGRLRGQTFRIAELEADLRQALLSLATLRSQQVASAKQRDDLRAIRGIGPRFAEQLRELGFDSFERIAALGTDDLVRIAARLRISVERIERDGWPEQARALITARANA